MEHDVSMATSSLLKIVKSLSKYLNFYCVLTDRYQVVGRVVHMDLIKGHLEREKNVDFEDSQERSNNIELEVLADTVYVKVGEKILNLIQPKENVIWFRFE